MLGCLVRHVPGPCTVTVAADSHGIVETSCGFIQSELYLYNLTLNQELPQIDGVMHYNYEQFKILPRSNADLGLWSAEDGGVSEDAGIVEDAGFVEDAGPAEDAQ